MSRIEKRTNAREVGVADEKYSYAESNVFVYGLFFLYVVTFFLQLASRIDVLGAIRFQFLISAALVGLAILRNATIKMPSCPITGLLIFFIILVAIQVPFSINVLYSYSVFVDRFLQFSAMAFFIAVFASNPTGLKVFVAAFLFACFKMGQEGLVGHISGSMIWENQGVMRLHGSTRLYAHPNSFAGMALGTLPFIYYLFPLANKYLKGLLAIMVVFAGNIIIFSASRTAYVGFFALVLYIFLKSQYKKKFLLVALFLAVAAVPYVPEDYKHRFESIFTGEEKEGNSSGARMQILEDSIVIFMERPFGVGVSAFPEAREQRFGRKQDTHNLYMEVATNIGIQGLIVFLGLIGVVLRELNRLADSFGHQKRRMKNYSKYQQEFDEKAASHVRDLEFLTAMTRAIASYLVIRLVLGIFGHDLYEIYWWVTFGFVYALFRCNVVAKNITDSFLKKTIDPN